MRAVIVAVAMILLMCGSASAYTCTSVQSGNYSDAATWTSCNSTYPQDGDTIVMNNAAHAVTVAANATIGTSPAAGTAAVTVSAGTLTVATGVTFTVKGDISIATGGIVNYSPGSTNVFDNSVSSAIYRFIVAGNGQLNVNGTSGSRVTLTKNGASTWYMSRSGSTGGVFNLNYADISYMDYPASNWAADFSPPAGQNITIDHCLFNYCKRVYFTGVTSTSGVTFTNNTFTNSTGTGTGSQNLRFAGETARSGSQPRIISGNVFDFQVQPYTNSWDITNNIFTAKVVSGVAYNGFFGAATGTILSWQNNMMMYDGGDVTCSGCGDTGLIAGNGIYGRTYVATNDVSNPHLVGVGLTNKTAGTIRVEDFVYELFGDGIGDGDCLLMSTTSFTGGLTTIEQVGNIVLPDTGATPDNTGTLFTLYGHPSTNFSFMAENNTYYSGTQGPATQDNSATKTYAGEVSSFRNNIQWDSSARGYKLWQRASNYSGTANANSTTTHVEIATAPWVASEWANGIYYVVKTSAPNQYETRIITASGTNYVDVTTPFSSTMNGATFLIVTMGQVTTADYNAGYNFLTGTQYAPGYQTGTGYNGLMTPAAFGVHDIEADPQFIDSTRRLATWDASLGGPGTATNAITELRKRNSGGYNSAYNIENLIDYVRAGFTPQTASFATSGYGGTYMGAVQFSAQQGHRRMNSFNIGFGFGF